MLGMSAWRQRIVLTLAGLWLLGSLPALMGPGAASKWLPAFLHDKTLTFGLDLQGGSHLLLEVDEAKLLADHYSVLLSALRRNLRSSGVRYKDLRATSRGVSFVLVSEADERVLREAVTSADPSLSLEKRERLYLCTLNTAAQRYLLNSARDKSIETIRRRVDETGTKEPLIQAQGEGRILLQVPGTENPERVKELVGKTARLTFQMVDQMLSLGEMQSFTPSADQEVLLGSESEDESEDGVSSKPRGRAMGVAYVVNREVLLSGDRLVNAQPSFDEYNQPQVQFVFDGQGADIFAAVTRDSQGQRFAIVLDGRVICAPGINEPIPGGRGVITGSFSVAEASDLALLMRSGSLPAPLHVLEERVIGPGLGADSINLGLIATVLAIIAVVGIMFMAYGLFGIFANLALTLNLCLLLGSMAWIGATMTLPGIAGIALTLGMAVDANVLINERIREEIRLGRRFLPAIDLGYQRAMTTIIDSNLTTLIGAFLLYGFGTGPVRGFAVTLALGILISMFTAVGLSKVFVAMWLRLKKPKVLWL